MRVAGWPAWRGSRTDRPAASKAQADLSQLPVGPEWEPFWRDLLPLAASSLELILRRLGLELDVLADPANQALAERLLDGTRTRFAASTATKDVGSAA